MNEGKTNWNIVRRAITLTHTNTQCSTINLYNRLIDSNLKQTKQGWFYWTQIYWDSTLSS